MALYVVAEPRAEFERWLARDRPRPPPQPANADLERGQQVLLGSACEYCHTIAGTNASGTIGPDLTPRREPAVARRRDDPEQPRATSPAGSSTRSTSSPGNRMPATALTGPELQALLDYLESLR